MFFMIHGKLYVYCMIFRRTSGLIVGRPSFIVLDAKCQAFAVEQPPGRHSALDFCRTNTKNTKTVPPTRYGSGVFL